MTYKFQYKADRYLVKVINDLEDFKIRALRLGKNLAIMERIVKNWDEIRDLEIRSPNRIENINLANKPYKTR